MTQQTAADRPSELTEAESAPGRSVERQALSDRYELEDGNIFLTGVQALVRLPIDIRRHDQRQGRDTALYVSGYEGSPLAGYDLELAKQKKLLDQHTIHHQPGLNEEIAATAVQGTQLAPMQSAANKDGVVGLWYGKAPGLDRAADAIRHGAIAGTHPRGGVVAIVGDDAVGKSSSVPSGSETAMAELGMVVMVPSDPQDIIDLGVHAVEMSRFSGMWVGIKVATNVADGANSASVGPVMIDDSDLDSVVDGASYVHEPTARLIAPYLVDLEKTLTGPRMELARRYVATKRLNRRFGPVKARIGIVTAGMPHLEAMEALQTLGIDEESLQDHGIAILKLNVVHPLDPEEILSFAAGLDELIVIEEKRSFIELAIKDILSNESDAPVIVGKTDETRRPLIPAFGDIRADVLTPVLADRISRYLGSTPGIEEYRRASAPVEPAILVRKSLPLMNRTPHFCSGCPHNRSTVAPEGSLVGGGIGCHSMALFLDEERVGDMLGICQMGGEGAPWMGMERYVDVDHLIQNIGDGTFHHSGSLAVRAAVAAGTNITYKILYNSAVAMTGGQDAVGAMNVPDLSTMLLAEGVKRVVITAEEPERYTGVKLPKGVVVRHRDELIPTQEELAAVKGVTVLIHDQECSTELRRKRKRGLVDEPVERAFINERVCEGCGDCGEKSNCLSVLPVDTEFGRKTRIHQPSCNKDYSCLDGDCPSFLSVIPGTAKRAGRTLEPLTAGELPDPRPIVPPENFSIRLTGIGGTGIVTTSAVLARSGVIAGQHVTTLDQLGLAQKGGAVVSDIKISSEPIVASNRVAKGQCDLYLVCDVLVGASESNLEVANPEKTVAVINSAQAPTGAMVTHTDILFPPDSATVGSIEKASRNDDNMIIDAQRSTLELFGDDQFANIFMVGVAHQRGALPIPTSAIEEAISLNGVAVERNLQAFRRGRQSVSDPVAFTVALADSEGREPERKDLRESISTIGLELGRRLGGDDSKALRRLVEHRAEELVAYQDRAYAEQFVDFVEKVRMAEHQLGSTALAEAVAKGLYKLMAYKDEYEVARLSLDPEMHEQIRAEFGDDAKYSFRLHPPILRALGMDSKIALNKNVAIKGFRALYAMRRLRGTRLDPFGIGKVREVERHLISDYRDRIETVLDSLGYDNHPVAVSIADAPDMVRGYEEIKLRNVEAYHAKMDNLMRNYSGTRVSR